MAGSILGVSPEFPGAAMVEISLLGRVAVVVDGQVVAGEAAQRRRIALLALLATPPVRPVSRDRLMLYLWPDNDTESARHLLSVAVHVLRKALGHDALATTADEVALNLALCRSDVGQFQEALQRGDAEAAVAIYGGAFMDGFHAGTGPEFEQWLDGERTRLQREYATALEAVAQRRRDAGDVDGAVAAWRAIALLDPYSSHGALGLMRALADAGNRVAAIRHAGVHRQLLRSELEAEPDPEVEALAEELRHAEAAARSEPARAAVGTASGAPATPGPPRSAPAQPAGRAASAAPAPGAPARPSEAGATPPLAPGEIAAHDAAASPGEVPAGGKDRRRTAMAGPLSRARWLLRRPRYAVLVAVALALATFAVGRWVFPRGDDGATQKLAVMRCVNRTPGDTADLLAQAVPQDIHRELGKEKRLQLIALNSSFALKPDMDVRAVGRSLGADLVMTCAVERSGDSIAFNVELSGIDGLVRWQQKYVSRLFALFALKESISRAVTQELFGRAEEPAGKPPDPVAYMHVLEGRRAWYQRSPQALEDAARHFQAAVAVDSAYADAWAALAETYVVSGGYDYGVLEPDSAYPAARDAAQKALELRPDAATAAEAHAALASVYKDYYGNLQLAEQEFRRAIAANPGYSTARQWYSLLLLVDGRDEEARRQVDEAGNTEPNSAPAMVARAHYFYYRGDFPQAIEEIKRALTIDPDFGRGLLLLALSQIQSGQASQARALLEGMRARAPEPVVIATLGYAYAREGLRDSALACRRSLEQTARKRYVPPELFAMLDVGLDDRDRAFADLEEMQRRHSNGIVYLGIEPIMAPLRSDPRFRRLMALSPAARGSTTVPAGRTRTLPSGAE